MLAAGGTAGHVVPALAVAEVLRERGAEVIFIGGERAERSLVPAAGFPLRTIAVEGMSRTNPLRAARALARAAAAAGRARALLAEIDPDAVMGGGGYVSGPVGLAALWRRIPLVLTEADSHLGVANRALAPAARRVCLSFPIAGRRPPRYLLTGRPTLGAVTDRRAARERFGLDSDSTSCVLIFGGSLGARSINLAAVEALGHREGGWTARERTAPGAAAPLAVLHICGTRDHAELAALELPPTYRLIEQLEPERFAEALAASDLVVARAGGSVFEIAAHGRPAILVPYPQAAHDHQSANARWMERAGAAIVVPDRELSAERLAGELQGLLGDPARMRRMADSSRGLARPEAARQVAAELLEAAGA